LQAQAVGVSRHIDALNRWCKASVMSTYCKHDMNLKEISAVLKVTESRVCQLHS
jgi:DNA-directed RNA polymerase specialized sigma subunit